MIIVNMALSFSVLMGIIMYKRLRPHKNINYFYLLIIISILPLVSLLRKGVYESGDFNLHIYRAMVFYENLKQGILIPSWGGDLNNTYGYPVFIFNYILHYYVISFFHFIGFSFITSMKFFLAGSYLLSGISMYLLAKKLFNNDHASFTAAIFYQFIPYHLVILHFRVNGENLSYALYPLFFYSVQSLIDKYSLRWVLWSGMIFSLFFFSHPATAIFSLFIIVPYCLFTLIQHKSIIKIFSVFLALFLGVLLASPLFYAHLFLSEYTYGYLLRGNISFTSLQDLLYSPWRYGLLFQGPKGELSFLIGYTEILIIFFFVIMLFRKQKSKYKVMARYWLFVTIILIFLITPYSLFFWKAIPVLSLAQFSYRLLLLASLPISLLAAYFALLQKRKIIIYTIIFLTISYTMLNWGNRRVIPSINDEALKNNLPQSTANYEGIAIFASPKWLNKNSLWEKQIPKNHLDTFTGSTVIKEMSRTPVKHEYIIYTKSAVTLRENTLFFPGWQVNIDGRPTNFIYNDKENKGKVIFYVPAAGLHFIEVTYEDLPMYAFTKVITLTGYFLILLYTVISFLPRIKRIRILKYL